MKKILLGTTAVVAISAMGATAQAADPVSIGVSGFMGQYLTHSNHENHSGNNEPQMELGQYSDTELEFTGDTTLDNGVNVAVGILLLTDSGDEDGVSDASYMTLSTDAMGALTLGSNNASAYDDLDIGAPSVGPAGLGDAGDFASVTDANGNTDGFAYNGVSNGVSNDGAIKVKYMTPTFNGFRAGTSYAAGTAATNNARNVARADTDDEFTVGARWDGEFSGASVGVSAGYYQLNGDRESVDVGANVGMAGFNVGGSYTSVDDDQAGADPDRNDGDVWELGVSYGTGPYEVSVAYRDADAKGTTATAGNHEDEEWVVGAAYDMGAGVSLAANYFNAESKDEDGTKDDVSGVVAGVEVSF